MESALRDGLHKAASNALTFAISKIQSSDITPEKMKLAQEYLRNTNPDAVNQLKLDDHKLSDIILSKITSLPNISSIKEDEKMANDAIKDKLNDVV
ncbi:hypothetical protein HUT03_00145 [Candidatus Liberibacter africanus]|nr:hypothetical protein HUT03_00145 [Candidatus Liberibacter africanus]